MAYFYVKDNGTATGDAGRYASQQTGSFATLGTANYYQSINAAFSATTPPVGGDTICVSDAHNFTASTTLTIAGNANAAPCLIIGVADANCDQPAAALGKESTGTNADIDINGNVSFVDIHLHCGDDTLFQVSNTAIFRRCKLTLDGAADRLSLASDGTRVVMYDTEIAFGDQTAAVSVSNGAEFLMFGGSVTTTDTQIDNFIDGGSDSGGCRIHVMGVDLSPVENYLVAGMGASAGIDDSIDVIFQNCRVSATLTGYVEESFGTPGQRAQFIGCGSATGTEYQYYLHDYAGTVESETTIRRADDQSYPNGTTISYKFTANANCSPATPLVMDFPSRWSALSTSTDSLRFYVASAATLTDNDAWADVLAQDGTNNHISNYYSSMGDLIDAGTTLTTDSGSDWRNGASPLSAHNEYYFDVATSGDAASDGAPLARVCIAKASTTVYVASEFEAV